MSKKARGSIPSFMWETYRAMSVDVGRLVPFFVTTACMNPEERKIVAYIEGFKEIFGEIKRLTPFIEFLEEKAKPFYVKLGRARWGRDVVTDLGFAKALQRTRKEKLSNIFEYDPAKDAQE